MNLKHIKFYFPLILLIITSCSKDQFKIVSETKTILDDIEKNIITLYDDNYDVQNIDWNKYEAFASELSDKSTTNYEIYFFDEQNNTPELNTGITMIDTNYHNSCIAKYTKIEDQIFFKKYPFKVELGIHEMFMNKDSTFTISFYAIRPFDVAGYQMELAPNNIFTYLSVEDEKLSGEYGFAFMNSHNTILAFSFYGASIPKSISNKPEDNILCVMKAKCDKFGNIKKSRYHLDSVFSNPNGEALKIYNVPYAFKN